MCYGPYGAESMACINCAETLQDTMISMHAFGLDAAPAVDFLNSRRPDILDEVGSTEYCDVFVK